MPDASSEDFARYLDHERAVEEAALAFRRGENRRHAGVSWSGCSAGPLPARSDHQIRAAARARLRESQAWRDSPEGAFVQAVAAIQRAAAQVHSGAEQARAAAARGLGAERDHAAALVNDLRVQMRHLMLGLRGMRQAVDRLAPGEPLSFPDKRA